MARVTTEIENHVATVTMTRPDKMNALDPEMIEGLIGAAEALAGRDEVRAVVLHGEGRGFCAGLDLMSFATLAGTNPEEVIMPRTHGAGGRSNLYQHVALCWRELPVPVIAALHGICIGGGLQIALGADIRIAGPDLKMGVMEMKWGLVPDMGGMVLMPETVRGDVIRRLTYTNETFGADQARDWGFVTEVADDPLARAQALAAEIAGKSPSAIRAAKALIGVAYAEEAEAVLLAESRAQADLVGRPHQLEAVAAGMQKRAAKFA